MFLGFPCDSAGKEPSCNAGDLGLIPCLGRYPGEGKGYPLQYSGLENSMNCIVHRVAKSRTRSKDFHSLIHVSKRSYLDFCIPNCRKWKFHVLILLVLYLFIYFSWRTVFANAAFGGKKKSFYSMSRMVKFCLRAMSCLTLCDPVDYSPPGSSVHEIS